MKKDKKKVEEVKQPPKMEEPEPKIETQEKPIELPKIEKVEERKP